MWRLFATTGVRRGEALGLRWKDVDLDAGVIAVANTRTVVTGRVVSGPPKTRAGERTIAIDGGTIAALKGWKKVQNAERLAMGADWPRDGHHLHLARRSPAVPAGGDQMVPSAGCRVACRRSACMVSGTRRPRG